LPLIGKPRNSTIFWHDLRAINYAPDTDRFMEDKKVDFDPKDMNPAVVPEDKKIESYWNFLMQKLKKTLKTTENNQKFEYRKKRASSRNTKNTIKVLIANVREKVHSRKKLQNIQ
jgi:hypothetical protein